jgi:uncharacterized surface protein with fasciclin (FAS1) repeats
MIKTLSVFAVIAGLGTGAAFVLPIGNCSEKGACSSSTMLTSSGPCMDEPTTPVTSSCCPDGKEKSQPVNTENKSPCCSEKTSETAKKDECCGTTGKTVAKKDDHKHDGDACTSCAEHAPSILQLTQTGDNFKTLAAALKAAGLEETLSGKGPFTVFAPTDEAFAKLPAGKLEELMKPENKEKLIELLTFHVVGGAHEAGKLKSGALETASGRKLKLTVDGDKVKVNGSGTVVKSDVKASNGVVHVVDTVLLPAGI